MRRSVLALFAVVALVLLPAGRGAAEPWREAGPLPQVRAALTVPGASVASASGGGTRVRSVDGRRTLADGLSHALVAESFRFPAPRGEASAFSLFSPSSRASCHAPTPRSSRGPPVVPSASDSGR